MAPEHGRPDKRTASVAVGMGVGMSPAEEARALAMTCDLCQQRMQTVVDLLLLTSDTRPVWAPSLSVFGDSVAGCRETVAARTRGLAVLLRDLAALEGLSALRSCVEELCELVVSLTECSAHAAYLLAVLQDGSHPETPGPVDRYPLCRAAAEVEHRTGLLRMRRLHSVTTVQLTDICIAVTESTNVLTDGCLRAADEASEENTREQFRLCLKSVAAAVNTFCGSVKFLKDRPSEVNYRACQVFGEALTTACNALAVFATQDPQLTGSGARLSCAGQDTLHAIFSACMGIVSPCILACSIVRDLGYGADSKKVSAKIHDCQVAVGRSAATLTQVLGSYSTGNC